MGGLTLVGVACSSLSLNHAQEPVIEPLSLDDDVEVGLQIVAAKGKDDIPEPEVPALVKEILSGVAIDAARSEQMNNHSRTKRLVEVRLAVNGQQREMTYEELRRFISAQH